MRCGSCKDRHGTVSEVQSCYSTAQAEMAEQNAEIYAEAVMSWVMGGGSPDDASRYASVVASGQEWNGGIEPIEFSGEKCEHGLALELCEGPQHYPMDM